MPEEILNPSDGSSPRMRGKRQAHSFAQSPLRIIPAHAGQTESSSNPSRFRSDHPRACGANWTSTSCLRRLPGSSPRMRGKHGQFVVSHVCCRIIPAHAGQTPGVFEYLTFKSDHPRACGANGFRSLIESHNSGSSPRMRGKLLFCCLLLSLLRIIPAHAGQTGPYGTRYNTV